jgi:hypothetical protein
MELTLIRKWLKQNYTIGKLSVDGERLCDTLEDPVRDLSDYNHDGDFDDPGEGKIYGQTAIPPGRYEIAVTESYRFKKRLPVLLDVPGFTAIRIHNGATAKNTDGCILVGRNHKIGRLENGPYYETVLVQRMEEALKRGEQIFITIKQ